MVNQVVNYKYLPETAEDLQANEMPRMIQICRRVDITGLIFAIFQDFFMSTLFVLLPGTSQLLMPVICRHIFRISVKKININKHTKYTTDLYSKIILNFTIYLIQYLIVWILLIKFVSSI